MHVIDCNVLAKQVLDEPKRGQVMTWFEEARGSQWSLLTPELAVYELGSVLARERAIEPAGSLDQALSFALLGIETRRPAASRVFAATKHGLTFHDASYVALAQETGSTVVTLDEKMAKVARKLGLSVKTF